MGSRDFRFRFLFCFDCGDVFYVNRNIPYLTYTPTVGLEGPFCSGREIAFVGTLLIRYHKRFFFQLLLIMKKTVIYFLNNIFLKNQANINLQMMQNDIFLTFLSQC